MVRTQDHGPALSRWGLAVAALLLLAGCASMPATSPAATDAAPAALAATAAPVAAGDASAAAAATTIPGSPSAAAPAASAAPPGAASDTPTAKPGKERATATAVIVVTATPTATESATVREAPGSLAPAVAPAFACTPGELTPAQTEGPYYTANPPETASLLQPGMSGTKITVSGYVLDVDCHPVPGARVDFWQADSQGRYDNQGYTLRGYQLTDAQGRYSMETVVPGLYPGRTSHIHVKVTAPNGPTLTTQIYFPDEAANVSDGIYNQRMLLTIEETGAGKMGRYDFVINTK